MDEMDENHQAQVSKDVMDDIETSNSHGKSKAVNHQNHNVQAEEIGIQHAVADVKNVPNEEKNGIQANAHDNMDDPTENQVHAMDQTIVAQVD